MNKILPIIFSLFFCIVINAQQVGTSPVYDKNGNVGIGTAAPSTFGKLHVDGGNLLIRNNSSNPGFGNGTNIVITNNYTTEFSRHASLIFSNDENVFLPLCGISGIYDSWTPTNKGGMRLAFYTKNAAVENIPSEKMVITGSGNVGIGVATPNNKLEVNGSIKSSSINTTLLDVMHDYVNKDDKLCRGVILRKSRPASLGDVNQISFSINNDASIAQAVMRSVTTNASDGSGRFEICTRQFTGNASTGYTGQNVPWKPDFVINDKGFIGVGTDNPKCSLDVAGTIRATEIKVEAQTADFVFADDYSLKSLDEVKTFIDENKHLPDIPSAAQMEATGVNLAEMNKLLLQKIEELTLHAIDQHHTIESLIQLVNEQNSRVEKLERQNKK